MKEALRTNQGEDRCQSTGKAVLTEDNRSLSLVDLGTSLVDCGLALVGPVPH